MLNRIRDCFYSWRVKRKVAKVENQIAKAAEEIAAKRYWWMACKRGGALWELGFMTRDAAVAKVQIPGTTIIGIDDRNHVIFYDNTAAG